VGDPTEAVRFVWMNPGAPNSGGAIAVVQLHAEAPSIERFLQRHALTPLPVGAVKLRDLLGADRGLAARPAPGVLQLMPHAGPTVVQALDGALRRAGCLPCDASSLDPSALYPEASDRIEACMLDSLSRAGCRLAAETLLQQPAIWRDATSRTATADEAHRLNHLLVPPTVAVIGHANVGKSTLTNAAARRSVAVVADAPGTTLDHVGVMIELDGLLVHWIDTPGWRDDRDEVESAAFALARDRVHSADVVLCCADRASGFVEPLELGARPNCPVVRVGTRGDLGPVPGADLQTAALRGQGMEELARAVRSLLLPDAVLGAPPRWRFHARLGID